MRNGFLSGFTITAIPGLVILIVALSLASSGSGGPKPQSAAPASTAASISPATSAAASTPATSAAVSTPASSAATSTSAPATTSTPASTAAATGAATSTSAATTSAAPAGDATAGKPLFAANCSACHGPAGQGGVGPDLITLPAAKDMAAVIHQINDGGAVMPPFKGKLSDAQIADVAAFVTQDIAK